MATLSSLFPPTAHHLLSLKRGKLIHGAFIN
jgi:hypothetical protein